MNAKEKSLLKDAGKLAKVMQARAKERVIHTPGPWQIGESMPDTQYERLSIYGPVDEIGSKIAVLERPRGSRTNATVQANARLIAAAPDLLAALQGLGTHPEFGYCFCLNKAQQDAGHAGECREASAAIAKAEGK